ncbi:hypothetical protein KGF56_001580 [Candida oxycetoniae]|uniref:EamA domain-containing protein n=1 Tax=Candida oxycetoniae TaxID=497107 RepID=A0AAI9SYY4_9ASCO|nr:uncharacterized protein KGF56_001580 [Candida oxycetoniae]KAI3405562.2 hypothetical protein KGF56_001580 [Candida oxycetoniae]
MPNIGYSPKVKSSRLTPYLSSVVSHDPTEIIDFITQKEKRNYRIGIALLVVSIVTWITGLELVSGVLKTSEYKKQWFFAAISGSCYMVNFIPDLFLFLAKKVFVKNEIEGVNQPLMSDRDDIQVEKDEGVLAVEMTKGEVSKLALQVAIIYYLYNLFLMEALKYTSASNQTIIGSTTTVFTLIMGYFLNIEKLSLKKVVCVMLSCIGVFLVNFGSDQKSGDGGGGGKFEPKNPKLGNTFALAGAFLYACYLLLMRLKCGSSGGKTTNERRLFGYVGLITLILSVPLLYIVDFFDIEKFELPPKGNRAVFFNVFVNAVFSAISDFTAILAMLLTSPLVVSLTLTCAVPITIFVDYMILLWANEPIHNVSYGYVLGLVCTIGAVISINFSGEVDKELIDDVIENTLENAVIHDQMLSPVLSPLLVRPSLSSKALSIKSPLKQKQTVSPNLSMKFQIPFVPMYNLNENDESPPTHNLNHHPELYGVSSKDSSARLPNLIITAGPNHTYSIDHAPIEEDDDFIDV